MIHQIHSYIPDGEKYLIQSGCGNAVDKNLEYDVAFSIDFNITSNQPELKNTIQICLMRMLK